MSAHTPGPWFAKRMRNDNGNFDIDSVGGYFVAKSIGGLDVGEEEANARLIAAAPELLAALQRAYMALIGYLPGHRNAITDAAIDAARAAIAKAEGRS